MKTVLTTIRGMPIYWDSSKIWFTTGMTIDGDGSPRCYGPNNSGLDYTANAGSPGNWYGVVTDANGNPIVQGSIDPCPGMWVSQTSYARPGFDKANPRKYLDSETISFMVLPGPVRHMVGLVVLGCKARATIAGRDPVDGLCGDFGPSTHAGEGSILVAQMLHINPGYDARELCRKGGTDEPILWEFWPGQMSVPQNGEEFPLIPA